jgi:hypothetical protein
MASYRELSATIKLFEFGDTYVKQIEPDYPNMVCTQMSFYQDTLTLKEKGQYLKHGGVEIGVWNTYNEFGGVIASENMDADFPVTWENLEEILEDKKISLLTVDSIFRYYDEETDSAIWTIVIKIPMQKGLLYAFDARTGELIETETIDMRKER